MKQKIVGSVSIILGTILVLQSAVTYVSVIPKMELLYLEAGTEGVSAFAAKALTAVVFVAGVANSLMGIKVLSDKSENANKLVAAAIILIIVSIMVTGIVIALATAELLNPVYDLRQVS